MENQNINENPINSWANEWEASKRRGRIFGGAALIIAGIILALQELKQITIPDWVFSWQSILVFIGLMIGVKSNFKRASAFILIMIGSVGLVAEYFLPEIHFSNLFWPIMIIGLGLILIFKPRNRWRNHWMRHHQMHQRFNNPSNDCRTETNDSNDYISSSVVFGGVKKNIISKDFKGGEVNNVFGGTDINFTQADIQGTINLEINNVFGGVKLIVPAHWQVKSELNVIMGGVEDKRNIQQNQVFPSDKILVLKGDVVMGGVEIKSY